MAGADRMTIEEVVKQVLVDEHGDLVRAALEAVCRELMEGEVSALVGAELGERRPDDRLTHRNGYRAREWQTRAGTVELQIPKLRRGSYFPSYTASFPVSSLPGSGVGILPLCRRFVPRLPSLRSGIEPVSSAATGWPKGGPNVSPVLLDRS